MKRTPYYHKNLLDFVTDIESDYALAFVKKKTTTKRSSIEYLTDKEICLFSKVLDKQSIHRGQWELIGCYLEDRFPYNYNHFVHTNPQRKAECPFEITDYFKPQQAMARFILDELYNTYDKLDSKRTLIAKITGRFRCGELLAETVLEELVECNYIDPSGQDWTNSETFKMINDIPRIY